MAAFIGGTSCTTTIITSPLRRALIKWDSCCEVRKTQSRMKVLILNKHAIASKQKMIFRASQIKTTSRFQTKVVSFYVLQDCPLCRELLKEIRREKWQNLTQIHLVFWAFCLLPLPPPWGKMSLESRFRYHHQIMIQRKSCVLLFDVEVAFFFVWRILQAFVSNNNMYNMQEGGGVRKLDCRMSAVHPRKRGPFFPAWLPLNDLCFIWWITMNNSQNRLKCYLFQAKSYYNATLYFLDYEKNIVCIYFFSFIVYLNCRNSKIIWGV